MYYTQDGAKQQAATAPPVVFAPPQPQYMPAASPTMPSGPFMWSGPMGAVPSGGMGRSLAAQQVQFVSNGGIRPVAYGGQQPYPAYALQQPAMQQVYGMTADGRQEMLR